MGLACSSAKGEHVGIEDRLDPDYRPILEAAPTDLFDMSGIQAARAKLPAVYSADISKRWNRELTTVLDRALNGDRS